MTKTAKSILTAGAISGMLAVLLGAFGAHALKGQVAQDMLNVYQTAVQYHFYHTLALLLTGFLAINVQHNTWLIWSAVLMIAGLLLFCGSLYLLAVTGQRWLGAITPFGGLCFILAWLSLATAVWRTKLLREG
jgi:uncharacterized membrane protein YgdD (TMEM256/DUF423 family)